MKYQKFIVIAIVILFYIISLAHGTCVFESDFGFILNCNFKKSSLFRVRNLGGVKAHFGLGFSVGDELGFGESLGNVEGNKRRSINQRDGLNTIGVLPASKLPPIPSQRPPPLLVQNSRPKAVTNTVLRPMSPQTTSATIFNNNNNNNNGNRYQPMTKVLQPRTAAAAVVVPTMTEAISLPLGVPAFKPISKVQQQQDRRTNTNNNDGQQSFNRKIMYPQYNNNINNNNRMQSQNLTYLQQPSIRISMNQNNNIPSFQAMPASVTRISTNNNNNNNNAFIPGAGQTSSSMIGVMNTAGNNYNNGLMLNHNRNDRIDDNTIYQANQIVGNNVVSSQLNQQSSSQQQQQQQNIKLPHIDLKGHTIEELAAVANVSVKVIQAAIQMKQQQLLTQQLAKEINNNNNNNNNIQTVNLQPSVATTPIAIPTTTVITTTQRPFTTTTTKKYSIAGGSKVMNAPKEYYPVGYDKNFDDNFVTKVDLPPTTFHCGDQKHFPGLYGDIDLGCMVFHVCALTDDGLIMKSFLCPESTLFDQTILKCNWWFYVECKTSKNLYDSNLPVSKSYQLMKALTFFSKYKNSQNIGDGVDVEALKNSVVTNGKSLN